MSKSEEIAPGVRRILAPNPGPMTYQGTNTYLLGRRRVAIVDPGPEDAAHLARMLDAVGDGEVTHILITHAHVDHTSAVPALAAATGAAVLAFGRATDGRSAAMAEIARRYEIEGGEGLDLAFEPDQRLSDGAVLESDEWQVEALHTPGHLSNHMSFFLSGSDVVLTGDTVMGWSSTLISPPDGSISAFMGSMDRLMARPERLYLPGHGPAVDRWPGGGASPEEPPACPGRAGDCGPGGSARHAGRSDRTALRGCAGALAQGGRAQCSGASN